MIKKLVKEKWPNSTEVNSFKIKDNKVNLNDLLHRRSIENKKDKKYNLMIISVVAVATSALIAILNF